ncbi:hypothetical protein BDV12DRAFT_58193 [Aspergillus spectabilis]
MTGSEMTSIDLNDPKVPRRQGDARAWNHRNLLCITHLGPCPICGVTCCVREEVHHQAQNKDLDAEAIEKAKSLLKIIDHLGPFAKDAGTFSQCSPPDGCGRCVCSECCGVCPSEICHDIQCKVRLPPSSSQFSDHEWLMKHGARITGVQAQPLGILRLARLTITLIAGTVVATSPVEERDNQYSG